MVTIPVYLDNYSTEVHLFLENEKPELTSEHVEKYILAKQEAQLGAWGRVYYDELLNALKNVEQRIGLNGVHHASSSTPTRYGRNNSLSGPLVFQQLEFERVP